jgi:hypothetical protein
MGRLFARRAARRRAYPVAITAAAALAMTALTLFGAEESGSNAVAAMESFLANPAISHEYRAWRRLEASGVGQSGWLDVQTSFTVASGLLYEVTAEGGSGYIRTRVLRPLLDEEQRLIARGAGAGAAISTDNYTFGPAGVNDEGLAVVGLKPLRKDRSLIAGQIVLTPFDGDLVRVEGRLARNPSFWVTRVNVVRSYRRINGARMPVLLETTARLRLLGSSALRMTYRYSHIDEQPVVAEQFAQP